MKGNRFQEDRFIADIHNSAKVWISYTEYTICNKNKVDGFYTIFWVHKFGKIFSAGIQVSFILLFRSPLGGIL